MKQFIFILIFTLLFIACGETATETNQVVNKKTIQVSFHRSVETVMFLRAISNEDWVFTSRKDTFKGRPLLYEARQYFKQFKNHPAVEETQKLLEKTEDIGSILFQGLLYAEEIPSVKLKYELSDSFWFGKKDELVKYLNILKSFYEEAKVEEFLNRNKKFYEGAIAETQSYLNNNAIETMEKYFGKENNGYHLIIMPLSPFGMGFGADIEENGKKFFYEIISPANDIEWKEKTDDYKEFGYGGKDTKEYFRDMVTHEFCHSFISGVIQESKFKNQINQYDSLYTPLLDSMMHTNDNGYGDWWSFVNEHLVRLGEIRIALSLGMDEDADEMRKENIRHNKFVLLPEAEKLMEEYEHNRDKYKTIDDFLPVLIQQMKNYNRIEIDDRITNELKKNKM